MRVHRLLPLTALTVAMAGLVNVTYGADLLSLYREAAAQDPAMAAARASLSAARERVAQAEGSNGFATGVAAGANANYFDLHVRNLPQAQTDRAYLAANVQAFVNKPLYRPANDAAIEQANVAVKLSELSLKAAEMDVANRLAQAYFDVLLAQDNVRLVEAQKAALSEQLAQAKRNFEVGTATIVDTNEAQSRYDQVLAQEISARNEVDRTRWALRNVVGRFETNLKTLRGNAQVSLPTPASMEAWVSRAEREAYPVQIAQQTLAVSEYDVKRAEAAKSWTLDATANVSHTQSSGSSTSGLGTWTYAGLVGVTFNLPFDTTGGLSARIRETLALVDKNRNDLETARRTAGLSVRQAYLGVTSGVAGVAAQQQALKSAETQLASTKLGLEVGVRTNLDVLNAQQQVTQVQRDLAQARYNTLLNDLRLKAATGVLGENDLRATNAYLTD
ncbi:MAG TPA: TolC family outer membrane protein [Casimicrobium huifangae]|jgi:outer membrane protein|nr:TolC family outer membrane protein [Casimicrobium huifangae]HQA33977.1 TolC family outer membrane protein [Casimicrobium huifangae]HQD65923.1 TolC family outer membrane protein [Casimicrobium huifangae]